MIKLKDLTDIQLIRRVKSKFDNSAMEILIDRHQDIFRKATHQYHRSHPETNLQDLLDDLYIVFNRAIETYNIKKKTKLSTWIYYHSRWHCLNSNKQYGKTRTMELKDIDFINESNNKYQNFSCNIKEMNNQIFYLLGKLEDKRISKIFKERFVVGGKGMKLKSWKEIAPKLGISISYTIQLYQKGLKFLNAKMKSNVICDEI